MLVDLAFHLLLLQAAGNREVVKLIADKQIMIHMFGRRTDSPEAWSDSSSAAATPRRPDVP